MVVRARSRERGERRWRVAEVATWRLHDAYFTEPSFRPDRRASRDDRSRKVQIIGEVAGAVGFPRNRLYARYKLVFNAEHWHVLRGADEAYTHLDETSGDGTAIWNQPIDVHFGTDSLEGWPRIRIEVWSVDIFDRSKLAGYGMLFLPSSPGIYDLDCVTWAPLGTPTDRLYAALLGAPPHLIEVGTAASGADRFEMRTETRGYVLFHLEVLFSGFAERNVCMGPRRISCL